jgi:beta-lactamase regulating signal transducer with metallopeptidase domain
MQISPEINSGISSVDRVINPVISETFAPTVEVSVNPLQIIAEIAAIVWLLGVAAMLIYAAVSFIKLSLKVRPSVLLRDKVYYCDDIDTPFILGIIRPRIYIPSGLSEDTVECVSKHEHAHLKRCDHLIKPLGFLILSVYWFNPLFWIAYILLCRDIEAACDERVIKEMDNTEKRVYSEALLSCSTHRRMISACPLAFGEVGVKNRIKSVLNYKKPAFWIIILALLASLVVAVCFLTNPKDNATPQGSNIDIPDAQYTNTEYEGVYMVLDEQKRFEGSGTWPTIKDDNYYTFKNGDLSFKVTWHNTTDKDFTFGAQYDIQIKNGDKWVSVDTEEERIWISLGYLLPANGTHEMIYSANGYDLSKTGTYRIISSFYADGEKKNVWVEFDVVSNEERLNYLKSNYPEYFYSDKTPIVVYVWQMAANNYRCGILPAFSRNHVTSEILALRGISVEDTKLILETMNYQQVTISPIVMLYSSYHREINDEYIRELEAMFGEYGYVISRKIANDMPENTTAEYNGVKIISGNNETIPLSSMLHASTYEQYGWISGSGKGANAFFIKNAYKKIFFQSIPTITCDENIKLELSENCIFNSIKVYDLNHNEIKISGDKFENINDLSIGGYYAIMSATIQGDYIEADNKYESTTYEYLFGIIIK